MRGNDNTFSFENSSFAENNLTSEGVAYGGKGENEDSPVGLAGEVHLCTMHYARGVGMFEFDRGFGHTSSHQYQGQGKNKIPVGQRADQSTAQSLENKTLMHEGFERNHEGGA